MENILLEVGGKDFYIDIDALSECISVEKKALVGTNGEKMNTTTETAPGLQIDVAKYEIYRDLINTILTTTDVVDDRMGVMGLNSLPIPFKISFNTLLIKRIIKEL